MSTQPPPPLEPEGLFDGLRWGCIVRGALLDILLTTLAYIPMLLLLVGPEAFSEDDGAASEAIDQAMASPEGLLLGAIVGLAATVAGAYYAARRAGVHHLRHGGWVAVVSLLLAVPFLFSPDFQSSARNPVWYDVLSIAATLPAGLLGGAIARAREGAA